MAETPVSSMVFLSSLASDVDWLQWIATLKPSLASPIAISLPMRLAAPVMSTFLSDCVAWVLIDQTPFAAASNPAEIFLGIVVKILSISVYYFVYG